MDEEGWRSGKEDVSTVIIQQQQQSVMTYCVFLILGSIFFFSLREFVACSRLVGKTTPGLIFCVVSQHGGWVEERCQRGGADESYTSPVMRDDAKRTSLITDLSN